MMTWRNSWPRRVYNSQLQAHCGKFGVSTHLQTGNTATARVYDGEGIGAIRADDYSLVGTSHTTRLGTTSTVGHAAKHKHHRNNLERLELSGSSADFAGMTVVTASSFDNAFVSHMIPRTENQTRWITASLN